jgi:calcineurin-like phosphoesterase family protein
MSQPNIWFTSDTHFYHKNILKFCPTTRQGKDEVEMTELMIENWNSRIKPGDTVHHLGDFSFGTTTQTENVLTRLNGDIHLKAGNHDGRNIMEGRLTYYFASIKTYGTIKVGDHRIVMMHYPIESWDQMHRGTIHLHGHIHGDDHHECRTIQNRVDVGIDARPQKDMMPFHFDEVMEIIQKRRGNAVV